jgi:hypothetical protein
MMADEIVLESKIEMINNRVSVDDSQVPSARANIPDLSKSVSINMDLNLNFDDEKRSP